MREAVNKTERILAEALSPAVITPGKTTEKDVADFIRKRRKEMGLARRGPRTRTPTSPPGSRAATPRRPTT
jgi:Xaa-Pro aminopeptidase